MSHPIVHAEIRSSDPDATRAFFGELFGWKYPDRGRRSRLHLRRHGRARRAVHRDQPAAGRRRPGHVLRRRRRHGRHHRATRQAGRARRAGAGHRPGRLVRADRRPAGSRRGLGPAALTASRVRRPGRGRRGAGLSVPGAVREKSRPHGPAGRTREPNATLPGSKIGFLNSTSTVTASGSRLANAATQRALLHMPCAIWRGKPNALAVSG